MASPPPSGFQKLAAETQMQIFQAYLDNLPVRSIACLANPCEYSLTNPSNSHTYTQARAFRSPKSCETFWLTTENSAYKEILSLYDTCSVAREVVLKWWKKRLLESAERWPKRKKEKVLDILDELLGTLRKPMADEEGGGDDERVEMNESNGAKLSRLLG